MKICIVTGAARGIGRAIAYKLKENGYNVIATYNNSIDKAKEIENDFELVRLDITKKLEVKKLIDQVIEKYGKIDLLINNASISIDNEIQNKTKKEFMKVFETNVVGTFLISKYVLSYMNDGIIINISSTDAVDTYNELNIDYSASKAAINSLTSSLAMIYPNNKIIALMPLWVNTEAIREMDQNYLLSELKRTKQHKLLEPIEVADKIIELINSDIRSGSIVRMEEKNV